MRPPRVRRWFGKPVTGYHLCLLTCILLFLHLPQFYGGSWEREADLLAVPQPYLLAITMSLCAALAPALWTGAWADCAQRWGFVFGELLALTVLVTAVTLRPRRRELPVPRAAGPVKVKPK
jgi:hypothetical protein